MGESAVEDRLRYMMEELTNPTVAPYAGNGECRVRVSARAKDAETASQMCDELIAEIKKTEVGAFIYGIDVDSMENALVMNLRERGMTLACAEACTGGLIAKRITDISGCSDVFLGGCVTYANEAKEKLIGVKHETLEAFGAVSEQTAREMAKGVRLALGADVVAARIRQRKTVQRANNAQVGVGISGIAGPGGGTPEKPVGTVYIAVSTAEGEKVKLLQLSPKRSREFIRICAATNAMSLALKACTFDKN